MTPYVSAYVAAGYTDSPWARYNASKLAHIPEVAGRIAELQAEHRARAGISLEWLQAQLIKVIEARPDSDPKRRHEIATKIVLDADGVTRLEIDRLDAIVTLIRSIGGFVDKQEHSHNISDDLAGRLDRAVKRAQLVDVTSEPQRPLQASRQPMEL